MVQTAASADRDRVTAVMIDDTLIEGYGTARLFSCRSGLTRNVIYYCAGRHCTVGRLNCATALELLLWIREVSGSYLCLKTGCTEGLCGFI